MASYKYLPIMVKVHDRNNTIVVKKGFANWANLEKWLKSRGWVCEGLTDPSAKKKHRDGKRCFYVVSKGWTMGSLSMRGL